MMTDPLSITASIIAVTQVSGIVLRSLREIKNIPKDVKRLQKELDSLNNILHPILESLKRSEAKEHAVVRLHEAQGPLDEVWMLLEHLRGKLAPMDGLHKARKVVTWQFQKSEIRDILGTIERQKTLLVLALQSET